ncbi:hypothetical protein [Methanorbis furvi]
MIERYYQKSRAPLTIASTKDTSVCITYRYLKDTGRKNTGHGLC